MLCVGLIECVEVLIPLLRGVGGVFDQKFIKKRQREVKEHIN